MEHEIIKFLFMFNINLRAKFEYINAWTLNLCQKHIAQSRHQTYVEKIQRL